MGGLGNFLSKFSFDPEKIQGKLWWVFIFVWLLVVATTISSIYAKPSRFTSKQQLFWLAIIVLVPGLGVLAYLPFSFKSEGFNFMKKPKLAKPSASPPR
jgi:hypothetical protein